ncbi:MAG: DUF2207 domain-containing protein, partial [Chloroflexi bacterium]|nr:DUF2207 domain-containing protein [Chloroflexota bacterium]
MLSRLLFHDASRQRPGGAAILLATGALLAFVAASLAIAATASAQADGRERITSFDATIDITDDGAIEITEEITYDFGTNERRGILRDIPVRLYYDDEHDRLYPLTVLDVTSTSGAPDQYTTEDAGGGYLQIRIGNPDVFITGEHTYRIQYRVEGALNGFESHDELYWNATGSDWQVPIDRVTLAVTAPASITEVLCFAGPFGSSRQCDQAAQRRDLASFVHAGLDVGEGVTVVVGFVKGAIPEPASILEERWTFERAFSATSQTLAATGAAAAVVVLGVIRLLWVVGRDRRWRGSLVDQRFGSQGGDAERVPLFHGGPFPVEYSPPGDLRPGLIGALQDEVAHPLDVSATIVDLATRHYLRIEEVTTAGFLGDKTDWKLVRLPTPIRDDLHNYERILLNALFEDGDEVELSALRTKFHAELAKVQAALYQEMIDLGWYRRSPESTRNRWLGIGFASLVISIALLVAAAIFTRWALVPIPLVVGSIALIAFHGMTPARTAKGSAVLRQVRGFERFIGSAEQYRAQFAERSRIFYDYL